MDFEAYPKIATPDFSLVTEIVYMISAYETNKRDCPNENKKLARIFRKLQRLSEQPEIENQIKIKASIVSMHLLHWFIYDSKNISIETLELFVQEPWKKYWSDPSIYYFVTKY